MIFPETINNIKLAKYLKDERPLLYFLGAALLILVCAYLFFNRFTKLYFLYDDIDYLEALATYNSGNPLSFIRSLSMRSVCFKPMSIGACWLLNYNLFGLNPQGYYLFNIVIHSLNSLLLYIFVSMSFRQRMLGLVISLCYLAHPYNIEVISWISAGLTSQVVVMFSCLTLISYSLYIKNFKKLFLALSYLFFACAFLSREDTILLPLVIAAFSFLVGYVDKNRIKEIFGYSIIVLVIMAIRYALLQPKIFSEYEWNLANIQNYLYRNIYYLNFSLRPLELVFGKVNFLENHRALLTILKAAFYSLFIPFIGYRVYKNRKENESKLLIFGLIWYFILSITFNFMSSGHDLCDRYLSMSIIGILMALAALTSICLRMIIKNNIFAVRFLVSYFTVIILTACYFMVIDGFNQNSYAKTCLDSLHYVATINKAIKNNPNITTVKLLNFPKVVRFSNMLKLFPGYKGIEFIDIDKEETSVNDDESTFIIRYKER